MLAPAELNFAWDRRVLLAYAGILAASTIGRDGVSLRRGLRDGAPVIGAAWLALAGRRRSDAGGAALAARPRLLAEGRRGRRSAGDGRRGDVGRRLSPAAKLALLAGVPAASSYAAMNFTGSSPITSPSGVELEMRRALPWQGAAAAVAVGAWLASRLGG